ncbi:MAG: hypothetical protein OYH77_00085 [Pseudomonadota bacterium]|nr:hypothetical protein [Pseudomonadota bacterium]
MKIATKIIPYTALVFLAVLLVWLLWVRSPAPLNEQDELAVERDFSDDAVVASKDGASAVDGRAASVASLEDIYAELADIFLHSIGTNRELASAKLQQLNAVIKPRMPQLVAELTSMPSDERALKRRMALVDYFRYRMRWDARLIPTLVPYLKEEIDAGMGASGEKIQAMVMADKAELLGGIAVVDPDLARAVASDISDPLLRDLAAYEIYFGLQRRGDTQEQAMAYVRGFVPRFAL